MDRYTVERCKGEPRGYGYTIRDHKAHVQTQADVEGVGLCPITPIVHHLLGWYKRRRDAEHRAKVLNTVAQDAPDAVAIAKSGKDFRLIGFLVE